MEDYKRSNYIKDVLKNMPTDWLNLTTHQLDIYDDIHAKTYFLDQFETLFNNNYATSSALLKLPTSYDYIRLGHPLSCVLEWTIANLHQLTSESVISFSSQTVPVLAILRKNLLENKKTQIVYTDKLPATFNADIIKSVYGYQFELKKVENEADIAAFDGSTIFISEQNQISTITPSKNVDFYINLYNGFGSILLVNGEENKDYISEIQHVRRRETIAMTPANSLVALKSLTENTTINIQNSDVATNKKRVTDAIKSITGSNTKALVGSSGLSIQYAIMMGLIDDALENHKGKAIKFIVPPNCYGGKNDQARGVAACIETCSSGGFTCLWR